MQILAPEMKLPTLEIQYIKSGTTKFLNVISSPLDPLLIHYLSKGEIRMQIWLERELRKHSGDVYKRSWIHSIDNSNKKPVKLFSDEEYAYGGGSGWGWKTIGQMPTYSTTNGYVPTEFEITMNSIQDNRIVLMIPILDIFTNILKFNAESRFAKNGDVMKKISILSRNRATSQPLRVKLAINKNKTPIFSQPSYPIVLGVHKVKNDVFSAISVSKHIKISFYK